MRDHVRSVECSARERRQREVITSSDVENLLSNLENVKANSRRFLTAQAARALREETMKAHQLNAAKLFQAASAGDLDACTQILRHEAEVCSSPLTRAPPAQRMPLAVYMALLSSLTGTSCRQRSGWHGWKVSLLGRECPRLSTRLTWMDDDRYTMLRATGVVQW